MFIIWGFRDSEDVLGYLKVPYRCEHCNNVSNYKIFRRRNWFTLFWIPLIPVSTKYYIACPICNHGFNVPKEEAMKQLQTSNQV